MVIPRGWITVPVPEAWQLQVPPRGLLADGYLFAYIFQSQVTEFVYGAVTLTMVRDSGLVGKGVKRPRLSLLFRSIRSVIRPH